MEKLRLGLIGLGQVASHYENILRDNSLSDFIEISLGVDQIDEVRKKWEGRVKKYLIEDIDHIAYVPLHESHGKKCNELCLEAELDKPHTKAASLAEMLAEIIDIPPLIDVLVRVQKSNPHKLTVEERIQAAEVDYEISDNISTDNTKIKDKYILLIDDILTSTATTKKCIKLLRANGAKKVTVFCAGKTVFRDVFDNKNFSKTKFLGHWQLS